MADTTITDGVTLSAAAWGNDVNSATYNVLSAVSGTNTITATGPSTYTAYATKPGFVLIPANTTTGAVTINITPSGGSALGAKNVFCGGAACVGGELVVGVPSIIVYDGTQFNIIGPYGGGNSQSTFTATLTGCTTAPTGTVYVATMGKVIQIDVPAFTATSNATTKTLTGMPAGLRPATDKRGVYTAQDNSGAAAAALFNIGTDGVITLYPNANGDAWTASGTFVSRTFCISYTLN